LVCQHRKISASIEDSGATPYLLKTAGNPEGVDALVFGAIRQAVRANRYAFFTGFFRNFYNTDVFREANQRTNRSGELECCRPQFRNSEPGLVWTIGEEAGRVPVCDEDIDDRTPAQAVQIPPSDAT
jgi:hypothetical protein